MAGTSRIKFAAVLVLLVAACALVEKSAAATYVVGDNTGWTIPPGGASDYTSWAAKHNFSAGDILVFNFATGAHDVATVDKASFDSCSSTNPSNLITVGPANVTLTAGQAYYICTFGQHCSSGQKLAINVSAASTPSPSPSPPAPTPKVSPSPSTPPPTPTPAPPTPTPAPPTSAPTAPPTSAPTTPPTPAPATPSPTPTGTPTPSPSSPTPSPSTSPPPSSPTPSPSPPGSSPPQPSGPPTSPPPAAPPPGTEPPPSPPPSSAPTATATASALLVMLLSIVVGILC